MMTRYEMAKFHQEYMETAFQYAGRFLIHGIVFVTRSPRTGERLDEPSPVPVVGESKQALADGMRDLAQRCGGIAAVLMAEAWMVLDVHTTEIERVTAAGVANHPDRVECLTLTVEMKGETEAWTAPIERDAQGRGTVGAWASSGATKIEGRMVGLLPNLN